MKRVAGRPRGPGNWPRSLLGAKLALFGADDPTGAYTDLRARVTHLSLNEDPRFQDVYVEEMGFPAG